MQQANVTIDLQSALAITTTALSAALAVALVFRGLRKEYPVFFVYCLFDAVASTLFLSAVFGHARPNVIGDIAYSMLILRWPIEFYVVLELIDRILTDHRGLARIGRYVVLGALVLAGLLTWIVVGLDASGHASILPSLRLLLQADKGVSLCLVVFLAIIAGFLWFFPVRLSFNTKAYYWGYSFFFLAKAAGVLLLIARGGDSRGSADTIILCTEAMIQFFWLIALRQRGANVTPTFRRNWTAAEQAQALARLHALDQNISGSQGD